MNLSTAITIYVIYIACVVFAFAGWVMNIMALWNSGAFMSNNELILRIVGIPIGIIGAVVGWL